MWVLIVSLISAGALFAQTDFSPAVQEAEFEEAKGSFNPWYTGPLITGSSNVLPAGKFNIQPYLYLLDFFAKFDKHGKPHSIPNWFQAREILVFQYGITDRVNGVVQSNFVQNSQKGHHASHFGDTTLALNIGLFKEGKYTPGLLFAVTESFPSGRYQRFNPKKGEIETSGTGAFMTTFTLNFGKVVWWWMLDHPMEFRLSLNYQVSSRVEVHGFNAYGGGFNTKGKVHPGNAFAADIGYQFSFTQQWVLALDIVYAFFLKTTFSGRPGFDAAGNIAKVEVPFNDNFSLLPALEYNWNENLGATAGVWFSPWGRNSLQFIGAVASLTWTW